MTVGSRCSASDGAPWAALIGLPWAMGATGPDAYDCWAFAAMVQQDHFGRALVPLGADRDPAGLRRVVATRRAWVLTDRPRHGDMVEMRKLGRANHVGVWLDIDGGGVLHCQQGAGVCFDGLGDIRLMGWTPRFWTPGDPVAPLPGGGPRGAYVAGIDALLNPDLADPARVLAGHMAVPLAAHTGDSVARILARAGLDRAAVVVFVRHHQAVTRIDAAALADEARLSAALADLGLVPRADWADRTLAEGEVILVQPMPQGGGGKSNPLQIILQIIVLVAAVVAAFYLGPIVGGLIGTGAQAALAGSSLVFAVVSGIGSLALNALLPPPAPAGLRGGLGADTSPTYTANAQGAVARPGAPIPVCYGRHIHQLDDAAPPYGRFEGNVQVLYQILCLGVGQHALEEIRLGETAILRAGVATTNLPGVTFQHVGVNQPVTLCDDSVYTHPDVNGQSLEPSVASPWQIATPVGIETEVIEVDIGFSQLVRINSSGTSLSTTVQIRVEAQALDDSDATVGGVIQLGILTFTAATRSSLRDSRRFIVPEGRYQVRLTRTTAAGGSDTFDEPFWLGLKAILPGGRTYGDVELLALRVVVGEQVASQSARRVAVIKTRKLPAYVDGAWTAPLPTRSIAWAIADVMRSHGRLNDLDLAELIALHATWEARGDKLDVVIDQELSFWEALQGICRAGRAQPDQIGSRVRIWRDEPRALPRQLFSDRNIIRGSLVTRPSLPSRSRPQRLVADYIDERTWRADEVSVGPAGGIERRERYFGIAGRRQLTDEVAHDYRAARFRTVRVAFEAELEQRMLRRGDLIALAHRQLTTAQAVAIASWVGREVRFDAGLDWTVLGDDPQLVLTAPDGSVWGPVTIRQVLLDDTNRSARVSAADLDEVIEQGGTYANPETWVPVNQARQERIRGAVGPVTQVYQRLIVEAVGQERSGRATVTCLVDDPRAHDADVPLTVVGAPRLTGLSATRSDAAGATSVSLVGVLRAGDVATAYLADYSTDGAVSWTPGGSFASPTVTLVTPASVTHVRMAAVGQFQGPFVAQPVSAEAVAAPANLRELVAGAYVTTAEVKMLADPAMGAVAYQWRLQPSGGPIALIQRTATPDIALTAAQVQAAGALSRSLTVGVKAISASGGASAEITLDLTNAAPAAPTGLAVALGRLTWDPAAEADVIAWDVDFGGPATRVTTRNVAAPSGAEAVITARVRAVDRVGGGAHATLIYGSPPPPRGPGSER